MLGCGQIVSECGVPITLLGPLPQPPTPKLILHPLYSNSLHKATGILRKNGTRLCDYCWNDFSILFFIVLFKYLIWVKFTQNILREILDISLDYWLLRYEYLSDMGGFSLGWNINKSAFGLSIEFRSQAGVQLCAFTVIGFYL